MLGQQCWDKLRSTVAIVWPELYHDDLVFEKLRFQIPFKEHFRKKIRFRDGSV